jgi:hypothetical protein
MSGDNKEGRGMRHVVPGEAAGELVVVETLPSPVIFRVKNHRRGIRAATVSIDDFYLTFEGQSAVAAAHPGNPLLQLRGNAGSHDLELGRETLTKLKGLTKTGEKVSFSPHSVLNFRFMIVLLVIFH